MITRKLFQIETYTNMVNRNSSLIYHYTINGQTFSKPDQNLYQINISIHEKYPCSISIFSVSLKYVVWKDHIFYFVLFRLETLASL